MGASIKIIVLSIDKLHHPGLGSNLSPDRNQLHEFEARVKKVNQNCTAVVSMYMCQYEVHNILIQLLEPQTTYGMRLTQFDDKQCHQLDALVLRPTHLPPTPRSNPPELLSMYHFNMEKWVS